MRRTRIPPLGDFGQFMASIGAEDPQPRPKIIFGYPVGSVISVVIPGHELPDVFLRIEEHIEKVEFWIARADKYERRAQWAWRAVALVSALASAALYAALVMWGARY